MTRILERDDPGFPREFLLLQEPPERLWVSGDLSLLNRPRVSIIGSRHPSPYGIRVAYGAARTLAECGVVIVSGMAMGLDAEAHRGALDAGGGTIAVLGTGIDVVYPRRNAELHRRALEHGLVISEFAPGTEARRYTFVQRNRLIAALGACLLVVEGHIRGGTSNTVKWAGDVAKIFAVPGHIDDELAANPNSLLQNGAEVYLRPNDILQHLKLPLLPEADPAGDAVRQARREAELRRAGLQGAEAALYDLIVRGPVHVDALAVQSGVAPGLLLAALSSLELQGLVTQLPGKHFALAS